MATIERSIEVNVPLRTAYNQWTQFEEFPAFMDGVKEVHQVDDSHLHWIAEIGGQRREWDAVITEQHPDTTISWRSESGQGPAGRVTFYDVEPDRTKVDLQMEYEPEGFVQTAGDALGFAERRVEGDLERFKEFIENRGGETGAWRGTIE
jgi:uncharacterized membrane protein